MKATIFTLCFLLLGSVNAFAQAIPTDIPVGKRLKFGYIWVENGGKAAMNLQPSDFLSLVYEGDEIPRFTLLMPAPNREDPTILSSDNYGHTSILINSHHGGRVSREWYLQQNVQAYQSGVVSSLAEMRAKGCIIIDVAIFRGAAKEFGQTVTQKQARSNVILQRGTPSRFPLGDESFFLPDGRGGGTVWFAYDKASARVSLVPEIDLAEALAQGILYRLLVHPKGLVKPMPVPQLLVEGKPLSSPLIASLNGVVVVPVSLLKPFGVEVQTSRTSEMWTVTLRRGSRWVQVRAFGWEAQTPSGRVKLERAVFPFQGELVVPLRQVAEALGLSVQAQ